MKKTLFFGIILSIMTVAVCATWSKGEEPGQAEKLKNDLESVRKQIQDTQQQIVLETKKYWQKEHDVEYSDPAAAALREEIKDLEARLLRKRDALKRRLDLVPELRSIEKDRKALFRQVQDLREEERLILNEIAILSGEPANAE